MTYTYVGYPAIIWILGKITPMKPRRNTDWRPHVTACVPVAGGRQYLGPKVQSLFDQDWPEDKLDVIIYCDGDGDGCVAEAQKLARNSNRVSVIVAENRLGKPTALARMVEEARGEVLLMTDLRQTVVSGAVRALVELLADPRIGCVSGNLSLAGETGAGVYWRYEKMIREAEGRFRGLVGVSGALYVVRKADVVPMPPDTLLDDMWVPMSLRLKRKKILYAPKAIAWDVASDDEREFGRKVRTLAGNFQLFWKMPALLLPFANPSWFETVSHKVMRLACPAALVVMLLATTMGLLDTSANGSSRLILFVLSGVQGLFYVASALGGRAGRLARLARTFVVLNAAAVVGLCRWVTGRQKVTW